MKTQKEIIELLTEKTRSTKLAMLPGPLTQKDTRDQMSAIIRSATNIERLADGNSDTKLANQMAGVNKVLQKLKTFIAKLPN